MLPHCCRFSLPSWPTVSVFVRSSSVPFALSASPLFRPRSVPSPSFPSAGPRPCLLQVPAALWAWRTRGTLARASRAWVVAVVPLVCVSARSFCLSRLRSLPPPSAPPRCCACPPGISAWQEDQKINREVRQGSVEQTRLPEVEPPAKKARGPNAGLRGPEKGARYRHRAEAEILRLNKLQHFSSPGKPCAVSRRIF